MVVIEIYEVDWCGVLSLRLRIKSFWFFIKDLEELGISGNNIGLFGKWLMKSCLKI